jgi:hypothetical protein
MTILMLLFHVLGLLIDPPPRGGGGTSFNLWRI